MQHDTARRGAVGAGFRLDNERLAFRFTATRSDRYGSPLERLTSPARLADWLAANGLPGANGLPDDTDLEAAVALREAIHNVGTQIAAGQIPDERDVATLNGVATDAPASPQLTGADELSWSHPGANAVRAGLAVIAEDAIRVYGTSERRHLKTCADPACRGLYLDASQAGRRRWCSMNSCGNRAKKAKFRNK